MEEERRVLAAQRALESTAVRQTDRDILYGSAGLVLLLAASAAVLYQLMVWPLRVPADNLETPASKRIWPGYAMAAVATAAATWLRWELARVFGQDLPPYLTFFPAIILSALLGGTGAGLLATGPSAAIVAFLFLEPVGRFAIEKPVDMVSTLLFITVNLMMSVAGGALRKARLRTQEQARALARANEDLERKVEQLQEAIGDMEHMSYSMVHDLRAPAGHGGLHHAAGRGMLRQLEHSEL